MINRVNYLTKDGIEQIHQATLQVLSETGVKLTHPAGRDLLSAHGATLVADRVLFPPDLVIDSLAQCPPIVQSIGRDPNKTITLGDGKQFAHNTGEVPYYFETSSGLRRPATRQDNVKASRLADLLPHIDCVVPMFSPQDVEADLMRIWAFYDALSNTTHLGHFYHLPVNVYGFTSNATIANFQSAYERVLIALLPYLAGADMLSGIGDMEFGMTGSLAQMALDNELMDNIQRLKQGFAVDEDSLAVDLIHTVIKENRNNYIAEKHTVRYLRGGEVMIPNLAHQQSWAEWEAAGRPDITLEADAYADRLLAQYDGPHLPDEQDRELLAVIRSFHGHIG